MTLLSIFANNSIAVPLCTTFPNHELRYIVDHSEALLLLSSEKFQEKAQDVIKEGIQNKPIVAVEKITEGSKSAESIKLEDTGKDTGGMMLYTSGTTSRPASTDPSSNFVQESNMLAERCSTAPGCPHSAVPLLT